MSGTFQDGLEAAALAIEATDGGLFGKELLAELAARVRALAPGEVVGGLDAAFEDFKAAYKPLNAGGHGQRNHWGPAKKKFLQLVKVRKHDPGAIVSGTRNYAATRPDPNFVRAPEVFLNKEMFMTDYSAAIRAAERGRVQHGSESPFDVVRSLGQ